MLYDIRLIQHIILKSQHLTDSMYDFKIKYIFIFQLSNIICKQIKNYSS